MFKNFIFFCKIITKFDDKQTSAKNTVIVNQIWIFKSKNFQSFGRKKLSSRINVIRKRKISVEKNTKI